MLQLQPFPLVPDYRPRVWGGARLRAGVPPIGEAWLVYAHNTIAAGPHAGRTLQGLADEVGPALLGERVFATTGARFPLLVKLLDTAAWLSVQVHPNDAQAQSMEGSDGWGKTEAWHVLEADDGARVIAGLVPGTTATRLSAALNAGGLLDLVTYRTVTRGDTLLIPAGAIHAPGPGLLLYEVQQSSDLTYRLYDWDRAPVEGRALHVAKSLAVAEPRVEVSISPVPSTSGCNLLTKSAYFTLALVASRDEAVHLNTRGESFHIVTVTEGEATLHTAGAELTLTALRTAVVPADCGAYDVRPRGAVRALLATVR